MAGSLIIAMVLIVGIWTGLMVYKSQSKSQASTVDNAKNNNGPNPIDVLKKTFSAASDEFKNLSGSAFNALTPKEVYTNNPKN